MPLRVVISITSPHVRLKRKRRASRMRYEARRADYSEGEQESAAAIDALVDLFGLWHDEARALLAQGRELAQQEHSFYAPLNTIRRDFGPAQRVRLVEHLGRVSFANGLLNPYEDHYVRKIAHLLHGPPTDSILARNRARADRGAAEPGELKS